MKQAKIFIVLDIQEMKCRDLVCSSLVPPFFAIGHLRPVLPTVGGVSLTDVPHVPRARETLKVTSSWKL